MRLLVSGLACRRGGRLVLRDLAFALDPGEMLAVRGRNGAGKSTLLGALAGLLAPAEGTIALEGAGDRTRPESVHLLAHRDGLKPSLTAAENLRFARDCLGAPGEPAATALARVGLGRAADLPAGYLSAGQRRRLAIARLIVSRRPLWLLDEPTTALDLDGQAMLASLMETHLGGGGLIVAATHAELPVAAHREIQLGASQSAPGASRSSAP